jgi:hypothetical protein
MPAPRSMTHLTFAMFAASGLNACAGDIDELAKPEVAVRSSAIISDEKIDDETIDRLGLVQVDGGACSGVLLNSRRVLTAHHCDGHAGSSVSFLGESYAVVDTFEPDSGFDTPWGKRDLELLVLDRDVMSPSTNQPWELFAKLGTSNLDAQVGKDLFCYGVGPNQVSDGSPTGNDANEFYGALRHVTRIEDGVTYRVEPGLEGGDSGGPCFDLVWLSRTRTEFSLVSINGSSVRNVFRDGRVGPGLSAALTATDEPGINAWIQSHL